MDAKPLNIEALKSAEHVLQMIDHLRSEEASSVLIQNDNPDFGGPNCLIECNAPWTGFNDEQFTGATVIEALVAAVKTKEGRELAPETIPPLVEDPTNDALNQIRDLLQIMLHSCTPVVNLTDGTINGYSIKTGALHRILSVMQSVGKPVWVPLHVRDEMGRNPPQIPGNPDDQPDHLIRRALNLGEKATMADRALSVYQVSLNAWGAEDGATQDAKLIADHLVAASAPKVG